MPESAKMIIVLSIICGVAGLALASLKVATADQIEVQVLTFVQGPTLYQVFKDNDNDPIADRRKFTVDDATVTIFPAISSGKLQAVAVETYGKGYGGDIGVMVAFNMADDTIGGIGITTMKETPGVGTKVAKHGYTKQFEGIAMEGVALTTNGGSIDAVSGATYSSIGSVEAVNKAAKLYARLKEQLLTAW